MGRHSPEQTIQPIDHTAPARTLLWVTAIAIPLFGIVVRIVRPDRDPAFGIRIGIAILAIALIWASSRFASVTRWLLQLTTALACVGFLFFGARAVASGLQTGHLIGLLLISTVTVSIFISREMLIAYLIFVLGSGAVGFHLTSQQGLPPGLYYSSMTCLILGVGWITLSRAQLQVALAKSHAELEARVADRTRALEAEVVERRAAELSAIHADQTKSRFLESMSHELRTPLNAIIGYTEIVTEELEGTDSSHIITDLQHVLSSAKHLAAMISDLLDLSRIESGDLALHPTETHPRHVIDELLRLLKPELSKAKTKIQLAIDTGTLHTDPLRLSQIALNLLTNAIKFAPGGTIQIRGTWIEDGFVLEVEDDGIGIQADQLQHIFHRFTQPHRSTTHGSQGAGLGLAISQELAHRLGGELTVRSELGAGSTFRLAIPPLSTEGS